MSKRKLSQERGSPQSNDVVSGDGGTLATVYEKGSKLGLEPLDYGDSSLVGLWTFDEGTGTVAYDYSGNNANGTWAGTGSHYASGKVGPYAGQTANATGDYVNNIPQFQNLGASDFSGSLWIDPTLNLYSNDDPLGDKLYSGNNGGFRIYGYASGFQFIASDGLRHNFGTVPMNQWTNLAWSYSKSSGLVSLYTNGIFTSTSSVTFASTTNPLWIGNGCCGQFSGLTDDVRIYNRALSAAEIAAMYSGGK